MSRLEEEGKAKGERVVVRMLTIGQVKVRAVINHHIDHDAVEYALIRVREVLGNRGGRGIWTNCSHAIMTIFT